MLRVKCPHCGAGNQDATEEDTCWQCGNILGATVTRAEPAVRTAPASLGSPTQQLDPNLLSNLPPNVRSATNSPTQRTLAIALGVAVMVIGVLIILVVAMASRK